MKLHADVLDLSHNLVYQIVMQLLFRLLTLRELNPYY
jgi:hypothetical protein